MKDFLKTHGSNTCVFLFLICAVVVIWTSELTVFWRIIGFTIVMLLVCVYRACNLLSLIVEYLRLLSAQYDFERSVNLAKDVADNMRKESERLDNLRETIEKPM